MEKILKPDVLAKPLEPAAAYEANTKDWRYLAAAAIIRNKKMPHR